MDRPSSELLISFYEIYSNSFQTNLLSNVIINVLKCAMMAMCVCVVVFPVCLLGELHYTEQ